MESSQRSRHSYRPLPITGPRQPSSSTDNHHIEVVAKDIMKECPTVFDGQVQVMEGEQFHIRLQENAVPFCVKSPCGVPSIN